MRSRHERDQGQLRTALGGMAAAALVVMVIIGGSMRLADALRPQMGDILAFRPAKAAIIGGDTEITAVPVGSAAAAHCLLNPRMMAQSGGSLVIEAATFGSGVSYRVHWAGVHTSNSATDCGSSADLMLTRDGLAILSMAAGG